MLCVWLGFIGFGLAVLLLTKLTDAARRDEVERRDLERK